MNFGDCRTDAVASVAGEPLLCLGNDFGQTDLLLVSLDTEAQAGAEESDPPG